MASQQDVSSKLVKSASPILSIILMLLGCLVLFGWALNITELKSILPSLATMAPNTALCFVFIGTALWLLTSEDASSRQQKLAQLFSIIVMLFGLLSLSEYLFGWNLGIDELLFKDPSSPVNPGRMAIITAICFSLLGSSLWLLTVNKRYWLLQSLAVIVLGIALVALLGYLYDAASLYRVSAYSSIALHTVLGLVIASVGILFAHPQRGLMAVISTDSLGAVIARRLLPAVLLVPTIVGWLRLKGQQQGLYDTEFGLALFALSNIFIFSLLIWWNAHLINRTDSQRKQGEAALKRYAQRMEILHQIDIGIINATSIQEVVDTALKQIREIINCQQIGVALFDFTTNELNFFALDLTAPSMLATGNRYPIPPGYLDEFGTNTVRVIDDIQLLADANPSYTRLIQEGIRASLRVLLIFQGQAIGVLGLNADTPGFFTVEHQEIAAEIANQLSIAIKQMQLSEEVARHTALLEERVSERTAELQSAKRRVEAILNNSPDGILLIYTDLKIQQTNSSFNSLFACEPDKYFKKSLLMLIQAEDAERVTKLAEAVVSEQRGQSLEIHALRKDDTVFDAELSMAYIKEDGLVCTIRDITERKAQERQLRYHASLQESVSDAVIVTDMAFRIQSWNRAAERIYGFTSEEVLGKPTKEILRTEFSTPDEPARSVQQLREQGWWQGEVISITKMAVSATCLGRSRWLRTKVACLLVSCP